MDFTNASVNKQCTNPTMNMLGLSLNFELGPPGFKDTNHAAEGTFFGRTTTHYNPALASLMLNNTQFTPGWLADSNKRAYPFNEAQSQKLSMELELSPVTDSANQDSPVDVKTTPIAVKAMWQLIRLSDLCKDPNLAVIPHYLPSYINPQTGTFPIEYWKTLALDFSEVFQDLNRTNATCNSVEAPAAPIKIPASSFLFYQIDLAQGIPGDLDPHPGDIAVLVGLHVAVRDQKDWTWITFFWEPTPSEAADRLDLPFPEPIKHFSMRMNRRQTPPNSKWVTPIFNPYLENRFHNAAFSNCMNCHRFASFGAAQQIDGCRKAVYKSGDGFQKKYAFFSDYLWSLTKFGLADAKQLRWACADVEVQ